MVFRHVGTNVVKLDSTDSKWDQFEVSMLKTFDTCLTLAKYIDLISYQIWNPHRPHTSLGREKLQPRFFNEIETVCGGCPLHAWNVPNQNVVSVVASHFHTLSKEMETIISTFFVHRGAFLHAADSDFIPQGNSWTRLDVTFWTNSRIPLNWRVQITICSFRWLYTWMRKGFQRTKKWEEREVSERATGKFFRRDTEKCIPCLTLLPGHYLVVVGILW